MKNRGKEGGEREKQRGREGGQKKEREGESFIFNFKEIESCSGYSVLLIGFLKKSQKYILLERNWAQVQCNHSVFHTKMFRSALALGRAFQVIKACLVQLPPMTNDGELYAGSHLICIWKECYSSQPNVFQINTLLIDMTYHKTVGFLNWEYMIEAEHMVLYRKRRSSRMCE